jgi:hypothetical protein
MVAPCGPQGLGLVIDALGLNVFFSCASFAINATMVGNKDSPQSRNKLDALARRNASDKTTKTHALFLFFSNLKQDS